MTAFPRQSGKRVGMLTPSSNTVLEPYTSAMFALFGDEASAHFGRFRVVEISMSDNSQSQFTDAPILEAARSLADAKVDLIAWNGTSALWYSQIDDNIMDEVINDGKSKIINKYNKNQYPMIKRFMGVPSILGEKPVAMLGVYNKFNKYTKRDMKNVSLILNTLSYLFIELSFPNHYHMKEKEGEKER